MSDPFRLPEPFVVSFSGGRTSGYMLRRILDAYGGKMPDGGKVIFCNTGKERTETLDFVERCSLEWAVEVIWLEYRHEGGQHTFAVVNYATASRHGEPFEAVIRARGFLPNPVARFCTVELKIRTTDRYLRSLGWEHWTNAIGLRGDEPHRVARLKGTNKHSREEPEAPLHKAGVTEPDVSAFWKAAPFDLALQSHEGNCDLCFLKGRDRISRILRDRPDLAAWWIKQEQSIKAGSDKARNEAFRADRPRYESLLRQVQEQPLLDFGDEPLTECFCTD